MHVDGSRSSTISPILFSRVVRLSETVFFFAKTPSTLYDLLSTVSYRFTTVTEHARPSPSDSSNTTRSAATPAHVHLSQIPSSGQLLAPIDYESLFSPVEPSETIREDESSYLGLSVSVEISHVLVKPSRESTDQEDEDSSCCPLRLSQTSHPCLLRQQGDRT